MLRPGVTVAVVVVLTISAATGAVPASGGAPPATAEPATVEPAAAPGASFDAVITVAADANRSRVLGAVDRYGTVRDTADTGHLFVFATLPASNRSDVRSIQGVSSVETDCRVRLPGPAADGADPNGSAGVAGGTVTATGQTTPWGVDRIGAPVAAGRIDASGVDVAVLDTGVDTDHPDLVGALAWGVNTTGAQTRDGLDAAEDADGHGTHVSGTVAALDDDAGVVGTAPDVDLYAVKVQHRSVGRYRDLIEGIAAALAGPDGTRGTGDDADVLSISLGGTEGSIALRTAVDDAASTAVVVAAAGNAGDGDPATDEVTYPADYDATVAVAATDREDGRTAFSSEGAAIDAAAPGVGIPSTYLDGGYAEISGTSMATPHVAGVAAMLVAAEGERTTDQFRRAIDAVDVEPTGDDRHTGRGRLRTLGTLGIDPGEPNASPSVGFAAPASGARIVGPTSIVVTASDHESPPSALGVTVRAAGPTRLVLNATHEGDGRFTAPLNASAIPGGDYRLEATATDPEGAVATAARPVVTGPGVDGLDLSVPERFPYGQAVPVAVAVGLDGDGAAANATASVRIVVSASVPIGVDRSSSANGSDSTTIARRLGSGETATVTRRLFPDRTRTAPVAVTVRAQIGTDGTAIERTRSVRPVAGDAVLGRLDGRPVADLDRDGAVEDLTGDGRVTLADAVALDAAPVAALNASARAALDHTRDGSLTRADARHLAERAGAVAGAGDGAALPTDPDADGVYEDLDGDGRFDVLDVAWLLERFDDPAAWVTDTPAYADANGDGRLSVLDAAALLDEL